MREALIKLLNEGLIDKDIKDLMMGQVNDSTGMIERWQLIPDAHSFIIEWQKLRNYQKKND